jgi:hypothetical protein
LGKVLQRLLVCFAFAAALLAPALARAALLPSCDGHEQLTRALPPSPPPAEPPPADACSLAAMAALAGASADELGDVRVAAMCDIRGASVIAPQRVQPMTSGRIEAGAVPGADPSTPVIDSGTRHPPVAAASPALAEHAVLDLAALVPPATSELGPPFPPVTGSPRSGFVRGIDHPPR